MLQLSRSEIRLGERYPNRRSAIEAIGQFLNEVGSTAPAYGQSLLRREEAANTYLGNGVAIPHGEAVDANLIKETRVVVIQVPEGVEWKGREKAHLLFGIAAKGDEHIALLGQLTGIVSDSQLAARLARTEDANEIIAAINAGAGRVEETCTSDFEGQSATVTLTNPRGFHLRPASQLAEATSRMDGTIRLCCNNREADARSAISMVSLGITAGSRIEIRADSSYAQDHLRQLTRLFEIINDEPVEPSLETAGCGEWNPYSAREAFFIAGTLAAPGLAIGDIFHWKSARAAAPSRMIGDASAERSALEVALRTAAGNLHELAGDPGKNTVQRNLFTAHAKLIEDADLQAVAFARIDKGTDAVTAWTGVVEDRARSMEQLADKNLAERAVDLRDAGQRVCNVLLGVEQNPLAGINNPVILIADDLEPSETAQLSADEVKGICLGKGTPNAHAAIVARSLGIPMVVAMGRELESVREGKTVILDASGSRLLLNPTNEDFESAKRVIEALDARRLSAWNSRFVPAITTDGHRVEIAANIASVKDAATALESGAEGVGLVRTEFLFLDREHAPDEEEQYAHYRAMVEALDGLPMVLRTIDIGGDKPVDYLGLNSSDLSFLGLRGIRLGLARPEILQTQLRAVYRAARHGPIKLLFPMVATVNDFRRIRVVAEEARQAVDGPHLELGVMIEVPAAVIMAGELARVVDFFSIGTNDLTQYALAVDRTHPLLAKRADSLHPVVLRLIKTATEAAHKAGKWVGVCGGIAADRLGAQILTGLGVDELSMPPSVMAEIKETLRKTRMSDLTALAGRALEQDDAVAVRMLPPVA